MIVVGTAADAAPAIPRRHQTMALTTEATDFLAEASSIEIGDLKRMTVDQYEELAQSGVLDDPRVELVNGLMVRKMTQGLDHTSTLDVIEKLIRDLLPANWYLRAERPVRLPNYDEPEPDLAVLRGNPGDYRRRHPGPADVALVVEVADSSLRLDRGDKLRAYARSGIARYWIVNLVDRRIEAYSDPGPDGYGKSSYHDASSRVSLTIGEVDRGAISVSEVLPPARDDKESKPNRP
jgi:Uma2 family endonuclease